LIILNELTPVYKLNLKRPQKDLTQLN